MHLEQKLNKLAHQQMEGFRKKNDMTKKQMAEHIGIQYEYYVKLSNNPDMIKPQFRAKLHSAGAFVPEKVVKIEM